MAFFYNVNQYPGTGAIALYAFKEQLKTVGWVVKSSSDGTTYNSTGDQISSGGAVANGLGNSSAWFRIQCPSMGGVTRELCFQRGGNNSVWKIKYSYSAGFTGGSPGATRVPSATDETFIMGNGTDAAPTFGTLFGSDGAYKYHCAAADGNDGYMFYSVGYTSNAGALSHILYMDQIQADSISSLDIDGYVFFAANSIALQASNIHGHSSGGTNFWGPQSWLRKGLAGEVWSSTPVLAYYYYTSVGALTFAPKILGVNSFDGKDFGLPAIYAKGSDQAGAYSGFKGIGRLFKLASSTRSNGTTLNLSTTRDKIQIDEFIFPWNGSIAIL